MITKNPFDNKRLVNNINNFLPHPLIPHSHSLPFTPRIPLFLQQDLNISSKNLTLFDFSSSPPTDISSSDFLRSFS